MHLLSDPAKGMLLSSTFCQLIRDLNGLRICLGNWSSGQLRALDSVLLPEDSARAIRTTLEEFTELLIDRTSSIWEAWPKVSYLQEVQTQTDSSSSAPGAHTTNLI